MKLYDDFLYPVIDMMVNQRTKFSDYAKFANECNAIKRSSGEVSDLVELCKAYGKTVQVDAVTKALEDAKKLVKLKYPLIKHLGGATEKEIADYVKLIDKQETI